MHGFDPRLNINFDLLDRLLEKYNNKKDSTVKVEISKKEMSLSKDIGFGEDGWISPTGKYFYCKNEEHRFKAEEIILTLDNIPFKVSSNEWRMDEWLQEKGWIKIANGNFRRFTKTYPVSITKRQFDLIFDYLEEKNRLEKVLIFNDRRFKNYFEFFSKYQDNR